MKWTRLASTVAAGSTTLQLEETVDWSVGDEVMLTTSDLNPWHTETFRLAAVSGTTLTLSTPVQHRHIGEQRLYSGNILFRDIADVREKNILTPPPKKNFFLQNIRGGFLVPENSKFDF